MGLSWQQGPLSPGAIGRLFVPEPLPKRLLYAEPLRRRMRVLCGGKWIADSYHRIDIRQASRRLTVRHGDRIIADTKQPMVVYESGFAPRWYVTRADIDESALTPVEHQTFCPYKGLCNYYDIGNAHLAAWSYPDAYSQVRRISDLVSFEPDMVSVQLGGAQLRLDPGQTVISHGPDRDLDVAEALGPASGWRPRQATWPYCYR